MSFNTNEFNRKLYFNKSSIDSGVRDWI